MAAINGKIAGINAKITRTVADGEITKEKLSESVQKKIYDPDVVTSNGADLAEVGFWVDNNPENEDRLYRFISIAGETGREIKIADSNDQIAGTSNIIDNVGFLGNYTEGDEDDNTKVIVSIVGVVPVKTNDNTIKANDRVMSDDNGYAVKSSNNLGYRVLEVLEDGLLNIVVSPNTDMVQRIKDDMNGKQPKLTPGDNITIDENNVISAASSDKLELIDTYTFTEDSSTTTVWSLPSDADYLGLREVYIMVDLKSNSHGVTDNPYLNFWDRLSNSRTIMCQLCPCWTPVQTSPASTMNRCIYNGILVNGTMFPVIARYGNSKQYPYSINDNLNAQTYQLSRHTPYLNEIQLQCNGAGIGAGTEVTILGVKYYG